MRREVVASYLKLAGVLLAGLVVGRFGLPRIEKRTTHYVSISPAFDQQDQQHCGYALIEITTILGRTIGYLEGSLSLKCRQEKAFDNTVLDCRCPDTP